MLVTSGIDCKEIRFISVRYMQSSKLLSLISLPSKCNNSPAIFYIQILGEKNENNSCKNFNSNISSDS